ncbi:MAG: hypothetical protein F6K48_06745 [Okeania sp. SIO3H1]|nr:hypothetical protein [Okeania sp. SIO3H1]
MARFRSHPTQRVRYANDRCLGRLDMARGPRHPSTAFFPLKGEALNQNYLIISY